jgi:hypothetical protein
MKNKFKFKAVYLLALVPLVSTALYLVSMIFCSDAILYFAEYGFTPEVYLALAILIGVTALWAYCGVLFSRSGLKIGVSTLIANTIPILSTAVFLVLYIVYKSNASEELFAVAQLIGCLGTGAFGIISEVFYMLFSISVLMQIFISFAACILVFMMGYAIGGPVAGKKKDKEKIAAELERDRKRKEERRAAYLAKKNKK